MNKLIISIIIAVLFASCTDTLDVEPKNSITFENYFKHEEDLQALTYSAHGFFRDVQATTPWASLYPARIGMLADGVGTPGIRELSPAFYRKNCWPGNWKRQYRVISQVNTLLNNVDRIENVPEDRVNFYVGQCLFLRAYQYFHIARVWGQAPLITNSNIQRKAKASTLELLDFAIEDCKKATEMLVPYDELKDADGQHVATKQIAGKYTAYALLAHIYAWKASICKHDESWALAEAAASEVITKGNYALVPTAEDICSDAMTRNSIESILEIEIKYSELQHREGQIEIHPAIFYMSYPIQPGVGVSALGTKSTYINATTVEAMYAPSDERRNAYFYKLDSLKNAVETKGKVSIYKWRYKYMMYQPWGYAWMNMDANSVRFRLAGIILLRGECRARQGKDGLAIEDLNTVRGRSNAPLYEASEGDVRYMIFKEREKELLLEQHRYYDCVRNGYLSEISDAYANLTEQDIEDGALYMPVGDEAFEDNPMMTQNTYWLKRW